MRDAPPLPHFLLFGGVFANLRKATISFIMALLISVHMEQLGSYWKDFHDILCLRIFRKPVEETQISVTYDQNNGYFT
jgi:hypothetical protein